MNPGYTYRAIVRSVYDGDTIRCDIDLGLEVWVHNQALRLYGIDTPELRGAEREAGLAARDFLRSVIPVGSEIILETLKDRTGKYGRWLAILWLPHNDDVWVSVNQLLVSKGYAREVDYE